MGAQLIQSGDAPLLQATHEGQKDVSRGFGVGEGPVIGHHRRAHRLGHGAQLVVGQAGGGVAGKGDRVDGPLAETVTSQTGELVVQEAQVERGVVRHDHGVAREIEEMGHDLLDARGAPHHLGGDAGHLNDHTRDGPEGVHQSLERAHLPEPFDAHRADLGDLARPGSRTRGLQVDDHERHHAQVEVETTSSRRGRWWWGSSSRNVGRRRPGWT